MSLRPEDIPDFIDGTDPILRQVDIVDPDTERPYGFVTFVDFECGTLGLPGIAHGLPGVGGTLEASHVHHAEHRINFDVVDRTTGQVLRRSRRACHTPQSSF